MEIDYDTDVDATIGSGSCKTAIDNSESIATPTGNQTWNRRYSTPNSTTIKK